MDTSEDDEDAQKIKRIGMIIILGLGILWVYVAIINSLLPTNHPDRAILIAPPVLSYLIIFVVFWIHLNLKYRKKSK